MHKRYIIKMKWGLFKPTSEAYTHRRTRRLTEKFQEKLLFVILDIVIHLEVDTFHGYDKHNNNAYVKVPVLCTHYREGSEL